MKSIKIITIVGARPQFIKAAAVSRAVAEFDRTSTTITLNEHIVHTGQHYDENMSKVFFDQLHIPRPDVNLKVGSGPHGQQTGAMLEKLENVLTETKPDWVLIYGDTNSTLAGALAAAKLHIPVAHVEAGLRSYNRRMPEEINRIVADRLSTLLLCPTPTAVGNLAEEGITEGVHNVGDVMYDSVLFNTELAREKSDIMQTLKLQPNSYYLATIHRAENTDDPDRLNSIGQAFEQIDMPIILPMHPRTRGKIGDANLFSPPQPSRTHPRHRHQSKNRLASPILIEPVAYLDMLTLEANARLILTDSGGVQKEAYWFEKPCITLRDETEWVELVQAGCNRVVGADTQKIVAAVDEFEQTGCSLPADRPTDLYGDGHSAEKIIALLK